MRQIVAADIGGTHARFALATIGDGHVHSVAEPLTLNTADYASFQTAWEEFARFAGEKLPSELALAFAGPVDSEPLRLTNNPWSIRPDEFKVTLGIERHIVLNDFGAVAHAVANLDDASFQHVCGEDVPLPKTGIVTIVGPGTGLGVVALIRQPGHYHVIETEGGHVDFAPLDTIEDQILVHLRKSFRRVSVERLVAGRGLSNIHSALAAIEQRPMEAREDKALWSAALEGSDSLATAALDRYCFILGAVTGDLALAQGASAVVIAGGLGKRLEGHLPRSGFASRFVAKGRFERRMESLPVKLLTYPQPGLYGAAAAFARTCA